MKRKFNFQVTLWDDKAEDFQGDKKNVLIKGGKINEWNGQKSVSTSFNSTCEIDPGWIMV